MLTKITNFLAISISDIKFPMENTQSSALVKTEGELLAGSDKTQLAMIKVHLETLQQLSLIIMEYETLSNPNENIAALLSFEADFIIKSYINTPLSKVSDHSGKFVKDNINQIPSQVVISTLLINYR